MSHFFICSSCNFTGNHKEHESCGRFFIFPTPTTVKRDPICFLREHWKKSFEAIQEDEKRKEEKADFIEAYSLLEYKAYMYWNKGFTALYQSGGRTLRFVGYQ